MKHFLKIEAAVVVVSVAVSLLVFAIEPNLVSTSNGVDTTLTRVGWPLAYQTTTSGLATAYTGPSVSTTISYLVYDWLIFLAALVILINIAWILFDILRPKKKEVQKTPDKE
jgi:hypothetical protein